VALSAPVAFSIPRHRHGQNLASSKASSSRLGHLVHALKKAQEAVFCKKLTEILGQPYAKDRIAQHRFFS
jgi:hypothetical protein